MSEYKYKIAPYVDFNKEEILLDIVDELTRQRIKSVVETQEKAVRAGLLALGWLPPEEASSLRKKNERLREALGQIAKSHDAGRHDGLPEECPAHDDVTMWAIAKEALEETE